MNWQLHSSDQPETLAELKQILLQNRSISDEVKFFNPPHPTEIALTEVEFNQDQVAKATELLLATIAEGQKILVFGDYDADGISATAIVWRVLYQLGADVRPFIPHRDKHGYGISDPAIDELLATDKPDLIITVDNGIVAHGPVQRLVEAGIKVIITDHHQPEADLPPAEAVVHSTKLCGATVGWILMRELVRVVQDSTQDLSLSVRTPVEQLSQLLNDQLDIAGLATIADQVPLLNANRSFATAGIAALKTSRRVGLQALLKLAGQNQAEITTSSVNFVIAPRINAMGRLESGLDALRLLCTTSAATAEQLASTLSSTNAQRQDLTYTMVEDADSQSADWQHQHLIVVASTKYHEGVIGLIAGRLAETYSKPAIVLAIKDDLAKASARSIPGVNIVELIREVKADLLAVGGHPMAAGFSVSLHNLEKVSNRLQQLALEQISVDQLNPGLPVECELPYHLVADETGELLETFEPFGKQNPRPIFGWRDLTILEARPIGRDQRHLKLSVTRHPTDRPLTCLWWNHGDQAQQLAVGTKIDLAGSLEFNYWNGKRSLQVKVGDLLQLVD